MNTPGHPSTRESSAARGGMSGCRGADPLPVFLSVHVGQPMGRPGHAHRLVRVPHHDSLSAAVARKTAGQYASFYDAIEIKGLPDNEWAAFKRMLERSDPDFVN